MAGRGQISKLLLRALVAAALLSTGSAAFAVGGASAELGGHVDVISCEYTGLMTTAFPDGAGTGVQSIVTDRNDGGSAIVLDVDTGNYTFSGPATCVVDDGLNNTRDGVWNANFTSAGDYTNSVCGSFHLDSTPGDPLDPDGDSATIDFAGTTADVTNVAYDVTFSGGNGELIVWDSDYHTHGMTGRGVLHVHPTIGNCATTDVRQWQMAGGFELTNP